MSGRRKNGQGSVRVLENGKADYRYTDPFGERVEKRAENEDEAYRLLNEAIYQMNKGIYIKPSKITVTEWIKTWMLTYKKRTLKDNSYYSYWLMMTDYIDPAIGSLELNKLRGHHVQKLVNDMFDKGFSKATIKLAFAVLNSSMKKAANPNTALILRNPCEGIEFPVFKEPPKKKKLFTADEQALFEASCVGMPMGDTFLLMLETGLRPGEAIGLKRDGCLIKQKKILVNNNLQRTAVIDEDMIKTGYVVKDGSPKTPTSARIIPLSNKAIIVLERLLAESKHITYVCTDWKGQPPSNGTLNRRMKAITNKAGLPFISPHKLRHSFATRCIEDQLEGKALQSILGHATYAMTMDLYVEATDDFTTREMNKRNVVK